MNELPDYVVINKSECLNKNILRMLAQPVTFPLSEEDQYMINVLTTKFRNEKNCVGLAAPQLGFHKRLIILEVKDDLKLRNWRSDLTDTLPESLWINPSYKGLGEEKTLDYEGCFSVDGLGGTVARFKTITYQGYDSKGNFIKGTAEGFLARVIQHEIDHINGTLFIDLVPEGELLPIEVYRKKRTETLKQSREGYKKI